MRQGDGRDREASIDVKGQHWRQQAADAETADRGYASSENTDSCYRDRVEIQSRRYWSGQRVIPSGRITTS